MKILLTTSQEQLMKLFATTLVVLLTLSAAAEIPKYNSNSSAPATVYLDFDGQVVQGTSWNWDSTIHAQPSGLDEASITQIFYRVAEDYRIFNINITTDSAVYANAPSGKRIRVIVTPTSHWYGVAGGISFVGSFVWGDGTPSFVFTDVLQNNAKYIAEACSHEAGHTLGLQHQSTFDKSCGLVTEYAEGKGTGETSWAPIMGLSYYKNITTWTIGTSIEGCTVIQNDISVIAYGSNNIGLQKDDHGNTMATASLLNITNTSFTASGTIGLNTDVDVFKIVFPRLGTLKTTIAPKCVGADNAGANLDIKVSLVKGNGDTIGRYNPKASLSAVIDTSLTDGTYYLVVDGVGNDNLTDYNSTGDYTITGGFEANAVLPITKFTLKGNTQRNMQLISWEFETDEPINTTLVECSDNGLDFKTIAMVRPGITSYRNYPLGRGSLYYRIKMLAGQDNTPYYSNIISLQYATAGSVMLLGNFIQSTAVINVSGDYNYDIIDESGRLLQRGRLSDGYNNVTINNTRKGLLLLKVYRKSDQVLFKIFKQ